MSSDCHNYCIIKMSGMPESQKEKSKNNKLTNISRT